MAAVRAVIVFVCLLNGISPAWASGEDHLRQLRSLDEQVQAAKQATMLFERDMMQFENSKIYPAAQQLRVFVTMEVFDFDLSSVQLSANGRELAQHDYTAREVYALRKGGVQEIFLGNVSPGVHTLKARFSGSFADAAETPYEKAIEVSFRKGTQPQWLELRIDDSAARRLGVRVFEREASQ